eukprot:9292127-Pyramimonas_sp.AAC.1
MVQCDLVDTAVHHDPESHARQTVRDILRKRPALTFDSEKEYLIGTPISGSVRTPKFSSEKRRQISELLTTALRHKLFLNLVFRTDSCGKHHPAMNATDGQ